MKVFFVPALLIAAVLAVCETYDSYHDPGPPPIVERIPDTRWATQQEEAVLDEAFSSEIGILRREIDRTAALVHEMIRKIDGDGR